MSLLRCTRCDRVGHAAAFCPFFRHERDGHADAQLGDNVPHINQVQITITADGVVVDELLHEERVVNLREGARREIVMRVDVHAVADAVRKKDREHELHLALVSVLDVERIVPDVERRHVLQVDRAAEQVEAVIPATRDPCL